MSAFTQLHFTRSCFHLTSSRSQAFVSGGFLEARAPQRIGTKLEGLIALADWYSTFAFLAGVDPTDHTAAAAGLPPIDSLNLFPYLTGATTRSPRQELWADINVLISGRLKLLKGSEIAKACWHGPLYPNASVYGRPYDSDKGAKKWDNDGNCNRTELCPNGGCLYDIFADESEHINLSDDPAFRSVLTTMLARLSALGPTLFNPNRGNTTAGQALAEAALVRNRGFAGPFVFPVEN